MLFCGHYQLHVLNVGNTITDRNKNWSWHCWQCLQKVDYKTHSLVWLAHWQWTDDRNGLVSLHQDSVDQLRYLSNGRLSLFQVPFDSLTVAWATRVDPACEKW